MLVRDKSGLYIPSCVGHPREQGIHAGMARATMRRSQAARASSEERVIPVIQHRQPSPLWQGGQQQVMLAQRIAAGGFIPTDIAGCVCWLDADQIVGLSDNDPVSTWTDASGNGNDAVQANGAKQPLYKTNILNGYPAVRFNGTSDSLVATYTLAQPHTYFIVTRINSFESGSPPLDGKTILRAMIYPDNATAMSPYNSGFGTQVSVTWANFNAICMVWDGASSLSSINGSETAQSLGTTDADGLTLGEWGDESGNFCDCDTPMVISYNSALNGTDRTTVMSYLAARFAL